MEALKFTTVVEEDGIVRVPHHVLEAAGMCAGTELHVFLTEDGIAAIRIQDTDPDQSWGWTQKFRAEQHEAMVERRAGGHGTIYMSDEEFEGALLAHMHKE